MSASTAALFKAEASGSANGSSQIHSGQSLGPGGRKLKTVDSGMDHLFDDGEDDGNGMAKRKRRELGEEGDLDEQVYEEDFADDDEKMEVDEDDEEAKELEVRSSFVCFWKCLTHFITLGKAQERIPISEQVERGWGS